MEKLNSIDGRTVKELWWEKENLHILYEDGEHTIYEGAYFIGCDFNNSDDDDHTVVQNLTIG